MPKVKPARTKPSLDMTPMVDLAFLLVTFFMLTTKFRPDDPVTVDAPSSISQNLLPDTNVMELTIDKDGKLFMGLGAAAKRPEILENMAAVYGRGKIKFTEKQIKTFTNVASFGVPFNQLPGYLELSSEDRKNFQSPGVPYDTSGTSEMGMWLESAYGVNPNFNIAIKGDQTTNLPAVRRVIQTLQTKDINKFNLITNLEQPAGK
jgi:biopolymer transport protein ExbD